MIYNICVTFNIFNNMLLLIAFYVVIDLLAEVLNVPYSEK